MAHTLGRMMSRQQISEELQRTEDFEDVWEDFMECVEDHLEEVEVSLSTWFTWVGRVCHTESLRNLDTPNSISYG